LVPAQHRADMDGLRACELVARAAVEQALDRMFDMSHEVMWARRYHADYRLDPSAAGP
jgi:hypothetical protein